MKDFAKKLYSSKAWKNVRDVVKKRDAYLCQDCLRSGMYTPAEEVHHIVELTPENVNNPLVSLNPDNLISLCRECHRKRHTRQETFKRKRRFIVDQNGKVTAI